MLDQKNKQILEYLYVDARLSTRFLAKKLHMKHPTVHARIKSLEQNGFIRTYNVLPQTKFLDGFHRIYHCSLTKEQEKKFTSLVECVGILHMYHYYTHQINMFFTSEENMIEFEKGLVKNRLTQIVDDSYRLYGTLFDMNIDKTITFPKPRKMHFDIIDAKLFSLLISHGTKKTILELAKELNTTAAVIKYRKKQLEINGYFLYFVPQPGIPEKSFIVSYHYVKLNKDIPMDSIKQLPRQVIAYGGGNSLTIIQLSHSMQDYLIHSDKLFNVIRSYTENIETLFVKDSSFLNRYDSSLFYHKDTFKKPGVSK